MVDAESTCVLFLENHFSRRIQPMVKKVPETVGERIAVAIERSGKSQAEVARLCGVTPQAVTKWIKTGKISKLNLFKLEILGNVSSNWINHAGPPRHFASGNQLRLEGLIALEQGRFDEWNEQGEDIDAPIDPWDEDEDEYLEKHNTEGLVIPLISWVQAGVFSGAADPYPAGAGEEMIFPSVRVGPRGFALRVRGDSMVNSKEINPTFPEGSVIIVDPDLRAENGSFVVVRNVNDDETTFKKLEIDIGGRARLVPLNYPKYQPIDVDEETVICGVVTEKVAEYFISDEVKSPPISTKE